MTHPRQFCGSWIVFDRGLTDHFPEDCTFSITDLGNGRYRFEPGNEAIQLDAGELIPMEAAAVPDDEKFKAGQVVNLAMHYDGKTRDGQAVYITVNLLGARRKIISVHIGEHDDHGRFLKHGGPHGVDG